MIGRQQASHLATRYRSIKALQLAMSNNPDPPGSIPPGTITTNTPQDPILHTMAGKAVCMK
jgi:hypothetical protein